MKQQIRKTFGNSSLKTPRETPAKCVQLTDEGKLQLTNTTGDYPLILSVQTRRIRKTVWGKRTSHNAGAKSKTRENCLRESAYNKIILLTETAIRSRCRIRDVCSVYKLITEDLSMSKNSISMTQASFFYVVLHLLSISTRIFIRRFGLRRLYCLLGVSMTFYTGFIHTTHFYTGPFLHIPGVFDHRTFSVQAGLFHQTF